MKKNSFQKEQEQALKRYPRYFEILSLIEDVAMYDPSIRMGDWLDVIFSKAREIAPPLYFWKEYEKSFPSELIKWQGVNGIKILPTSISDIAQDNFERLKSSLCQRKEALDAFYSEFDKA